jgi:uncharacterized membrane protein YeaQ/YmgE (transglycosylase-associated protein family)
MGILSWLVLGAIVGLLANALAPGRLPGGVPGTIVGGVVGAFLGGAGVALVTDRGITGFDIRSLVVAFVGAATLLLALHQIGRAEPRVHG